MPCSCASLIDSTARHFDENRVGSELSAYRRSGPGMTTRALLSYLAARDPLPGTVLDIGSGIGAFTLGMLKAGVQHAICMDMSPASLAANAEEALRQGVGDRIEHVEGDFIAVASTLSSVDLVVLDRVVCCYPEYTSLLGLAADHSRSLLAMSFPRDRWWVRLALWVENLWRYLHRDRFRAFVHSPVAMAELLHDNGFTLAQATMTWTWQIEIYERHAAKR